MKRLPHRLFFAGLLLALLAAGCAAQPSPGKTTSSYDAARVARPPAAPTAAPAATRAPAPAEGAGPALAAPADRKIIFTANLTMVVQDMEKTVATIKDMVVAQGGFVSSSNVWQEDNVFRGSMTVRVPAQGMDSFLTEVRKLAIRVEREQTGGQDVTEEYVDIEAQLKNLEATEAELRELMTAVREKTGKAEDIMAVYRELANVRSQIDRIKGRKQYIDRSVELATVNLDLSERGPEPIGQPGWQPLQIVRRALNALVEGAKILFTVMAYLVLVLVPLVGIPALVIWLIVRGVKRRGERKKAERLSKPESLS